MLPLAKEPTRVFMRASLLLLANVAMANAACSVTAKGQGTGDSGLCTGKTCRVVVEGCDAANGSGGGVTRDACKAACDGGATIATQIARNSQQVLFWVNLALCQINISPYYYYELLAVVSDTTDRL